MFCAWIRKVLLCSSKKSDRSLESQCDQNSSPFDRHEGKRAVHRKRRQVGDHQSSFASSDMATFCSSSNVALSMPNASELTPCRESINDDNDMTSYTSQCYTLTTTTRIDNVWISSGSLIDCNEASFLASKLYGCTFVLGYSVTKLPARAGKQGSFEGRQILGVP